jgi:peptide/nickel transport system ATP-binding protein
VSSQPAGPLLAISDLQVTFRSGRHSSQVVHGVSMGVGAGERVGIIGESGSGKTVTALSVLGLHDRRRTSYGESSSIRYADQELLNLPPDRMRKVRGAQIAMVFQDPATSLNPVFTIGKQLMPVLRVHQAMSREAAHEAALAALDAVEIRDPARVLGCYPHELSGGMRQRVLIAMAIACQPKVLIADEPTSALDVTVQATVLDLLSGLVDRSDMSLLLITHDMGVIARLCSYVYVMYAGRVVERGPAEELFRSSRHPYTQALLLSTPRTSGPRPRRLATVPPAPAGTTAGTGPGCSFAPRCGFAIERCRQEIPQLQAGPHAAACFRWEDVMQSGYAAAAELKSAGSGRAASDAD